MDSIEWDIFPFHPPFTKKRCVVGVMKENDIFLQAEMVSFCSPVLCVLNVRWRYLVADTCTKANGVLGPA